MVFSKTFESESISHNPSKWKQTPSLITPINNSANVLITNNLIICVQGSGSYVTNAGTDFGDDVAFF